MLMMSWRLIAMKFPRRRLVPTEHQRVMAIAAGMVGGRYDRELGVIVMENGLTKVHYNETGELIIHFDVKQTDKWIEYYTNRVRANYADKTAMVQRIIASKGRSV